MMTIRFLAIFLVSLIGLMVIFSDYITVENQAAACGTLVFPALMWTFGVDHFYQWMRGDK